MSTESGLSDPVKSLNHLVVTSGLGPLPLEVLAKFDVYLSLILRWNARTNLTAVRNPEDIVSRHFAESVACAQLVPGRIETLLDFGTGAGFPGIPIALCRPEVSVTLAESQNKKAAFLQEAVRTLKLSARVFVGRAETLSERFDCVTLRAVDQMGVAVEAAQGLMRPGGWMVVMTTEAELRKIQEAAGADLIWSASRRLLGSEQRVLLLGQNRAS